MRKFTKIFGIGLSRTGTHSLTDALRALGISAVHFPARFVDVEEHTASTDTRIADIFEKLDSAFPGSLFILTVRERESWLRSCERYWDDFRQFNASPGIRELHERLYGQADFDRTLYSAAYDRHMDRVARFFAHRRADLLEMNICAGESWPRLVAFLEAETPAIPFPHVHAPGGKRKEGSA